MSNLAAEILTIEGPDALAFAQAQLASDVGQLAVGRWQWSAWLSHRGRVRALGHLLRPADQQLRLMLRGGTAAAAAAALQPYVLRKRVTLTGEAPSALADAPPSPAGAVHTDAHGTTLGLGAYAMRITPTPAPAPQRWRARAIAAGHPWLPDATLDTLLAPALSLQALGAVSLDKGCFPGQEIVARLHYRGGCKQHIRRIESRAPLALGRALRLDGAAVGTTLDGVTVDGSSQALAVVRDTVPQGRMTVTIDDEACDICIFNALQ